MTDLITFFRAHGAARHERRIVLPFHKSIMRACTSWLAGRLPDGKRHLAICMPPRHGKTYIARDLVAWALALFPDSEFIYTSSSATLAIGQTVAIRDTVTSDWYRDAWPEVGVEPGKGRQDYFRTAAGGSVYGVGVGGTITGFGAGRKRAGFGGAIVIDDPIQAADAFSQTVRDGCNRWYTQTLYSRRNSDKTPILLIMQRLHEMDLVGYVLQTEPQLWHVMQIPVVGDDGQTIWPETFSRETAEHVQQIDPYMYSAQYLQKPTPAGGAMIRDEWLQHYETVPEAATSLLFTMDTALKTGQHNDYSVAACWRTDGINVYLVDILRGKWEAPDLEREVREFLLRHKPRRPSQVRIRGVVIEDKASGTGLIQSLRRDERLAQFPILAMQRDRDKVSRLNDVLPLIAAGRLYLPQAAPWLHAYIAEMTGFSPMLTHAHDDQVDVTIDALAEALQTTSLCRGMDLS